MVQPINYGNVMQPITTQPKNYAAMFLAAEQAKRDRGVAENQAQKYLMDTMRTGQQIEFEQAEEGRKVSEFEQNQKQKNLDIAESQLKLKLQLLGTIKPNDPVSLQNTLDKIESLFGGEEVTAIRSALGGKTALTENEISGYGDQLNLVLGKIKDARALKTWVMPDGSTVNLPNNVPPPKGAVPYSSGMDIEITPEGTRISTGVSRTGKPTVKTKGTVEEKAFNASEAISRLNEIAASYRPEFLQLNTKLNALNTKWQSIGKGTPLETGLATIFGKATKEDKQLLRDYAAFKRDSLSNINNYIKEITGAQMSEKEANRLRQAMPDPGEGIFDGDSPEEFEAKWNSVMSSLRLSQARYTYLLNQGISPESIANMAKMNTLPTLNRIQSAMSDRDKELEKEIKTGNPNITQQELDATIKMRLKEEFGI